MKDVKEVLSKAMDVADKKSGKLKTLKIKMKFKE